MQKEEEGRRTRKAESRGREKEERRTRKEKRRGREKY